MLKIPVTAQSREYPPTDITCWKYFIRNSAQYGDYTIFSHAGKDHSRSEFIGDVEALAAFFHRELGLKEQDVFTVFMPTNAESIITFMALNKMGIIVNFVHPLLPPESVEEILDFTNSKGIMLLDMFAPKYAAMLKKKGLPIVLCSPKEYAISDKTACPIDEEALRSLSSGSLNVYQYPTILKRYANQHVNSVPEGKGYIAVYMNGGGTTGKSKTIKLTNYALNCVIYGLAGVITPVENIGYDTELCTMPFFHAFGLCAGGLSALSKGSRAIFLPKFDADQFIALMKTNHVVEFNGVPNMYKKLVERPDFDDPSLKNIKVMYSGGDFVSPQLLEKIYAVMRKNGSNAEFCPGYGLTECGAVCSANRPWASKPETIGQPIQGLRFEIWDDNNHALPCGEIGQIVITGASMMAGYLTKNGPSDAGIYRDAYGTKWILTGDLGKMDEEGYITFIGRQKRVIIISGYNVYPVDIEQLVDTLPFVQESCAVQGYLGDKPIVRLFVVKKGAGDEDAYREEITALISDNLSTFNIPKDIQFIDEIPRTKLQKVDFMKLSQFTPDA
ncbi:MAG: acyl--CoA ligase [Clostridia bacterium]|nr:acyl--CoA ligase [Clostridia bacterium]